VCFPHFESRRHEHVAQVLGGKLTPGTVLQSDGYGAYAAYARKVGITNAQCWAHSRRGIFEAKDAEPQAAGQALEQIAALYKIEEQIRERKLNAEAKRLHRLMHSKPLVDKFFDWVVKQFEQLGLLPSNPLTKALAYVHERRTGLSVFLEDPAVAIDTNHIERALRPIPTGRNNAKRSLMRTCRLSPREWRGVLRLAAMRARSGLRIKTGVSCWGNPTSGDLHGCTRVPSSGAGGMAARQRSRTGLTCLRASAGRPTVRGQDGAHVRVRCGALRALDAPTSR
jgi:hypothetical protein